MQEKCNCYLRELNKTCANTECEKCRIGLDNPVCSIIQIHYRFTRLRDAIEEIQKGIDVINEKRKRGPKTEEE